MNPRQFHNSSAGSPHHDRQRLQLDDHVLIVVLPAFQLDLLPLTRLLDKTQWLIVKNAFGVFGGRKHSEPPTNTVRRTHFSQNDGIQQVLAR